jgi:hypothetical protein
MFPAGVIPDIFVVLERQQLFSLVRVLQTYLCHFQQ